MLPDEIRKSLFDIKESIDAIEGYMARFLGENRNFYVYVQDRLLRRGVERELEIIGEATNRILKVVPDFPITSARKIVDLRNFVIHAYDSVNDGIIWGIVINHLPPLRKEVDKLLG